MKYRTRVILSGYLITFTLVNEIDDFKEFEDLVYRIHYENGDQIKPGKVE